MTTFVSNWQTLEKKNKRSAMITSIVVHALLLVLLIILGMYHKFPPPEIGILVNFGTAESGAGDEPSFVTEEQQEVQPTETEPVAVLETQEETDVMTQNVEEAPVVKKQEEKKEVTPVKDKTKTEVKKEETKPVKEDPKVDPTKLYNPGKQSNENDPNSQGKTYEGGDQGDPEGDINSDNYGDNTGFTDFEGKGGYALGGRKLLAGPCPVSLKYDGTLVLKISVDRQGNVKDVRVISVSKNDPKIRTEVFSEAQRQQAIDALKGCAKFQSDSEAPMMQDGEFYFNYKYN